MGPEVWIAGLSAIAGAASSYEASRKQKQASKDAKEAELVQRNDQKAQDTLNRRAQIREERIRRAQIIQSAANSGVSGSSGEAGALSTLSSSIGANLSNISRGARTSDTISNYMQSAQYNTDAANASLAAGNTIQSWLSAASVANDKIQENKAAKGTPGTSPVSTKHNPMADPDGNGYLPFF